MSAQPPSHDSSGTSAESKQSGLRGTPTVSPTPAAADPAAADSRPRIRRALLSVYDKTGLVDFARALVEEFGVELISTGGTATALRAAGLPVTLVEQVTGFPELMDGRVKTLHPRIHAAILADRDNPEHMRQLAEHGIEPIDMVVVNLYPFEQTIARPGCTFAEAIEMIDIGGPCLLRAAAKNHKHVWVVAAAHLAEQFLAIMREQESSPLCSAEELRRVRRTFATVAFRQTEAYDRSIEAWLVTHLADETNQSSARPGDPAFPGVLAGVRKLAGTLRYGENPHQTASVYMSMGRGREEANLLERRGPDPILVSAGTELSHNNYLDASAALDLCAELTRAGAGGVWHRQGMWHRLSAGESRGWQPIYDDTATRRNLPHLKRPGATYFITFRLWSGALSPGERDMVMACILHPDGSLMALHAAVVLPDHVHLLLTPRESAPGAWPPLGQILQGIKGVSARRINQARGTSGALWLDEAWDRIIRDEAEFWKTLDYIHENSTRAGLDQDAPYLWCVFELEASWDLAASAAAVGAQHTLHAGQIIKGKAAEVRDWHRLIAGATTEEEARPPGSGEEHRLIAGATKQLAAGATEPTGGASALPVVCFIKHTNACGAAVATPADDSPPAVAAARLDAYARAYLGDPNAAMGGILAVNFAVDVTFAATVLETYAHLGKPLKDAGAAHAPGGFFVEVWLAPRFTKDAVALIRGTYDPATAQPEAGEAVLGVARDASGGRSDGPGGASLPTAATPTSAAVPGPTPAVPRKDWGQRVRLLAVGDMQVAPDAAEMDFKRIAGGMLLQTRDLLGLNETQWKVVTARAPTPAELDDLRLAWLVCKHTKSNAITICRDGMLLGNGAGQMSRVMSCRIATWLARENGHAEQLAGAVAASDAFFPFRDGPDILMEAGVRALIQPGGSKRDDDTIRACNERGVAMIFTGTRHFRH